MCGIAGYVGTPRPDGRQRLDLLAEAIAHRGPDAQGLHLERFAQGTREVGLAHRRLAILDLAGGDQPMANEDGRVRVVFNGEIYNHRALRASLQARGHRFASASDTETIVHAYEEYGVDCVHHLRGMFAFAVWDAARESLFLARDRYGEKPLHYAEVDGTLVFASELHALRRWPGFDARLNLDLLPQYLQYRYAPGPATWLRGVRKLSPGSSLRWSAGQGLRELRYYRPHDAVAHRGAPASATAHDALDSASALRDKLDETVGLMMDSDVPYGAFLSGGIDSAAIVALMARRSATPVRTFSIGFAEAGYSELDHAAIVARAFGTAHHPITVSGADIVAQLPRAAAARDAPIAEPADVPLFLLAEAARHSVKMVLTGEGSDEALGGYPKHVAERWTARYQAVPRMVRRSLIEPIVRALPYRARRLQVAIDAMGVESFEERMPRWFGALSSGEVRELCGDLPKRPLNGSAYPFESDASASALRRILYFDQTSWLPDNLLERGDRMTMAASLEARMPFMDHEFMELAASLPDTQRVNGTATKRVLREAVAALLPSEIVTRRKVGFAMPIHLWLRGSMREMLREHLLGPGSLSARLLNRPLLERYVGEHLAERHNHEKLLWMLLNFELWVAQAGLRA